MSASKLRGRHAALLTLLALCFLAPPLLTVRAAEGEPKGDTKLALRTAAALYEGVRTAVLPNGLRIFLKPILGSTAVTTMMVYKVGSADEDTTWTGLAHYLEHLMFKGTDKLRPGDIDRITFRNGGVNNAYTTTDLTAYHFTMPAGKWQPALAIEADRMRNLRIDKAHEFEQEKGAVKEELRRNEDTPWDLDYKALLGPLFGKMTPYGHPVIGEEKHVLDVTAPVIKAFYDKWYHPNNAALIVVGGFDADEALAYIRKEFTSIPAAKLPPRKELAKVELKRPARLVRPSKFAVARMMMAFNTVRSNDPDYHALNVAEALLGRGKTSRLYKTLVEGAELASAAGADHTAGRYPGSFTVQVELLDGKTKKDRDEAEKIVLKELARLRDGPVSAEDLHRVQHMILASYIFGRESASGLANSIADAVTVNDLDFARKYLPTIMAVTPADVQRVAKKYLVEKERVVVWSVPPGKGAALHRPLTPQPPLPQGGERGSQSVVLLPLSPRWERGLGGEGRGVRERQLRADAPPVGGGFSLAKTQRVELPNGLVVLLFENHRLPIVEAYATVSDASLYQPEDKLGVATLTGYMLDEGTKEMSGKAIAEAIENVGGELALSGAGGSVRVLAPDQKLGLKLLLESLMSPSFPKEAFGRNRNRLLSEIEELKTQPDARARQVFRSLVYGKHPLGRPSYGTLKTVAALTIADCAAYHKKVFVPNNATVAIVGDFDSKAVVEELKRLTADWKKAPLERPKTPTVEKPKAFTQKILTMPEASQLAFLMGHVGIKRENPDYYKLLVLDNILGTGPGFTYRLSYLRDRLGLAYTVSAQITSSAGKEPGTFTCYIGTGGANFAKVKKLILIELKRIRDEKPSDQEVKDARTYLIGSRLLGLGTNGGIAEQLLSVERYNLGPNYLEDFRRKIEAVTPEDIQAMARKYLDPARMILVAAGPIDQEGNPLPAPKKE